MRNDDESLLAGVRAEFEAHRRALAATQRERKAELDRAVAAATEVTRSKRGTSAPAAEASAAALRYQRELAQAASDSIEQRREVLEHVGNDLEALLRGLTASS